MGERGPGRLSDTLKTNSSADVRASCGPELIPVRDVDSSLSLNCGQLCQKCQSQGLK